MNKKSKLLLFLFFFTNHLFAKENILVGGKVGLSISFGTHVNRVGIELGAFAQYKKLQLNFISHTFYNFSSYGYKKKILESQLSEGLNFCFSEKNNLTYNTYFFNVNSNFSHYKNCIGYAFRQYFDTRKTTQQTAIIQFSTPKFSVETENDAFLFSYLDKYRTASLKFNYLFENNRANDFLKYNVISLNLVLFTGDVLNKNSIRKFDKNYKTRHGYMDLSNSPLGNISNGILSLNYSTSLLFNQSTTFQIGLDDERIRNIIQNKIIHDMIFLPKKWDKANNAYVPMLQKNNQNFLFKDGEKIKPTKAFFQFGINEPLNY